MVEERRQGWCLFGTAECKQWANNIGYDKTFLLSGRRKSHKGQTTGINISIIVVMTGLPAEIFRVLGSLLSFVSLHVSTPSCSFPFFITEKTRLTVTSFIRPHFFFLLSRRNAHTMFVLSENPVNEATPLIRPHSATFWNPNVYSTLIIILPRSYGHLNQLYSYFHY